MKALVLAAGRSTRIAGVSGGMPKPLIPIAGRPVLARTLLWLAEQDVREVWINLHHRPDEIRAAIGDGSAFGVRVSYAHEPEILGTAGAFRALAPEWTDATLVIYGDNLMAFDLHALVRAHQQGGADATVAIFDPARHVNSRIAGGRVRVSEDGRVTEFVEGGEAGFVNAGAYVLEPAVAARIGPGFQDFARDVFPALVAAGTLRGHVLEPAGYCIGIDTPETLATAEHLVATNQVQLA